MIAMTDPSVPYRPHLQVIQQIDPDRSLLLVDKAIRVYPLLMGAVMLWSVLDSQSFVCISSASSYAMVLILVAWHPNKLWLHKLGAFVGPVAWLSMLIEGHDQDVAPFVVFGASTSLMLHIWLAWRAVMIGGADHVDSG